MIVATNDLHRLFETFTWKTHGVPGGLSISAPRGAEA